MIKLAIVVGHTEEEPGAFGAPPISSREYPWNLDLAAIMVEEAKSTSDAEVRIVLRNDGGILGAYREAKTWGANASMELHFNSSNATASGSEALYVSPQSKSFAEVVQHATVGVLGLRDRGVKTPLEASGGRGFRNLSQMGNRPSILTEPFFGSNSEDCQVAHQRKAALAVGQIRAALDFLLGLETEEQIWSVTASVLNVRGGPGVEFEALTWGPLKQGDMVEVLDRRGDWAAIEYQSSKRGYVHASFLA